MKNDLYKFYIPTYKDKTLTDKHLDGTEPSIRLFAAKAEADPNRVVDESTIIQLVREFFELFGIEYNSDFNNCHDLNKNPITPYSRFYYNLQQKASLKDKRDLIWMKFTEDGFLGVVAVGNDINFNTNTASNKIIKYLDKKWDTSHVLIFPLPNITNKLNNRHLFESTIGNFLISKGVPILDFYSHNL